MNREPLAKPNVVGYSENPMPRIRAGQEVPGTCCVRVYLSKKVPLDQLAPEDLVPASIEGTETDCVVIGEVSVASLLPMLSPPTLYTGRWATLISGISIAHGTVTAGCFPDSALVQANPCLRLMRDVEEGDTVYAVDPVTLKIERTRVVSKYANGIQPTFKLSTYTRDTIVTGSHPFLRLTHQDNPRWTLYHQVLELHEQGMTGTEIARTVRTPRSSVCRWIGGKTPSRDTRLTTEWVPLSMLKPNDYVAVQKMKLGGSPISIPPCPPNLGAGQRPRSLPFTTSTEDFAWFAGYYLGDGWSGKKRNRAVYRITLCEADTPIRAKVLMILKGWGLTVCEMPDMVETHSKHLCHVLSVLGLTGTAHSKRIPDWVKGLPEVQIKAFILGLLEADGTQRLSKSSREVRYVLELANKQLCEQARQLSWMVGFRCSPVHYRKRQPATIRGRKLGGGESYQISVYPQPIFRSRRLNGGQFFEPRFVNDQVGFDRVIKVAPAGEAPTFDIQVESSHHSFCADGFVVHNSLGCFVVKAGQDYMLTNWHVAVGAQGKEGDVVYQPGPYDIQQVYGEGPSEKYAAGTLAAFRVPAQGQSDSALVKPTRAYDPNLFVSPQMAPSPEVAAGHPVWLSGSKDPAVGMKVLKEGRCFTKDTRIWTNPSGPLTIEHLAVGQHVYTYSPDSGVTTGSIQAIIPQGVRPVYLVKTRNRTVKLTGNHPLLTVTHRMEKRLFIDVGRPKHNSKANKGFQYKEVMVPELQWRRVDELSRGDLIVTLQRVMGYNTVASPAFAWLLGYFVADGSVAKQEDGGIQTNFYAASDEEAAKCAELLHQVFRGVLPKVRILPRGKVRIVGTSNGWVGRTFQTIVPGKKLEKRVPSLIWGCSIETRKAFIEGYLAGDGHRRRLSFGDRCYVSTTNTTLVEEIRDLCISCGYRVSNLGRKRNGGYAPGRPCAYFTWWPSGSGKRQYSRTKNGDGVSRATGLPKTPHLTIGIPECLELQAISEIKLAGEEETFDIEVAGGATFFGNGVLCHNTTGLTRGKVTDINATLDVNYGGDIGKLTFSHLIVVQGDGGNYLAGGDSGSVTREDAGQPEKQAAVGLNFAGSTEGYGMAFKMAQVAQELGFAFAPGAEEPEQPPAPGPAKSYAPSDVLTVAIVVEALVATRLSFFRTDRATYREGDPVALEGRLEEIATGAPVVGVTVKVDAGAAGVLSFQTDTTGAFRGVISGLAPGSYTFKAQFLGS